MGGLWARCVSVEEENEGVPSYWDAHGSIHWQDEARHTTEGCINIIKHYADENSDFDIYQLCAFDKENCNKKTYRLTLVKAIFCLILQAPTLLYVIYVQMAESEKKLCNIDPAHLSYQSVCDKFLAFGYSFFLGFYIVELFRSNGYRGMYCILFRNLQNKPEFINGTWIRIGGYYNILLSNIAIVASYVLVFLSTSVLDMVLNCVALFFVVELDDLLVTKYDYYKISYFISHWKASKTKGNDATTETRWEYDEEAESCFLVFWEDVVMRGLELLFLMLRIFVPFFIGVCH
mmetsp:Transcript_19018/g.30267  ORF Transcript_19018/g.30267 Transcript_19018/m.30267 type:complete len:290 (-) Transcript_19018:65-934(-)